MPDTHQIRLRPETVMWLRRFMARQDADNPKRHRMTYDEAVQALIQIAEKSKQST